MTLGNGLGQRPNVPPKKTKASEPPRSIKTAPTYVGAVKLCIKRGSVRLFARFGKHAAACRVRALPKSCKGFRP